VIDDREEYLIGLAIALLVVALVVMAAIRAPTAPAPVEPDTLGLVACAPDGACRYLDLSTPPPAGALLYVPDVWYRDLQRERDSLEAVIAKLRRWE
jgi:hypothetical protein